MASSYNATSGRYDPSKIQPKFRDCAFASDKNANNFAQWTKLISGIIRNITGGAPLEAFLNQFLDRKILNNTEGDLSHEIRRGEVKILNNIEGDLSHEIRRGEVKILIDVKGDDRETIDVKGDDREAIDVKGDDRKILNNIEGDLSHEIRRGEVKILIDVKDDLPHEIRDVSTAEMQSDPYPDCMIRYILETLNAEEDIETLNVEDDTKTLNVEDDTKTLNVEDYTETLNVEEALVIL